MKKTDSKHEDKIHVKSSLQQLCDVNVSQVICINVSKMQLTILDDTVSSFVPHHFPYVFYININGHSFWKSRHRFLHTSSLLLPNCFFPSAPVFRPDTSLTLLSLSLSSVAVKQIDPVQAPAPVICLERGSWQSQCEQFKLQLGLDKQVTSVFHQEREKAPKRSDSAPFVIM